MSRHENQNKKREKSRYVYRKFGITQRFDFEYTKQISQIKVVEVKQVPTPSLYRFVLPFLPFMVDLTSGKILNIWEESQKYFDF